ncbi:hypothetical protein BT96DRAFT_967460 [Gymnopus androsaceus JB14]|uniref:Protein-S-isoprenylcysteine O-methyltransferase n=1 Tax=Gymnopus androsaceus JB14 TaxID=1447944 RepID=A0A6A4H394_9AGAR|nr:hypothetical protein BT96DRAFT_967460 [Gymnopus androsaceus JB14]
MALEKVPLLLAASIMYYIAATPPNPPPSQKEISKYPPGDHLSIRGIPTPWAIGKFVETALDILVQNSNPHTKHAPAITPIFLVGFFLCLCGGCIRWLSYRALGRLFTFEVSIRDQHRLVKDGPYSVVRHPSYTGSICTCTGLVLCLFGPGSWLFECGWLELLAVQVFAVIATALHAAEDKMMQKEFGRKWDEWAKAVPYKLIPGIL